MGSLKVKSPGLLTTIQDQGRYNHQQSGVCVSGVMDSFAHRTANILVGNKDTNQGVLEITLMGPVLEFNSNTIIAITGADLSPSLNGKPINNWESVFVDAGSTLRFGAIKSGTRAYLAIDGGFDIPVVMGSKSTYMRAIIGGFEGRALKAGDVINCSETAGKSDNLKKLPEAFIPKHNKNIDVRVVLGPQDDYFTDEGIQTLLSSSYTVSSEFDRMGYRLEGANIAHKDVADIISDGMVMGAIQVPGGGQPIILMADRQTTGGYTKIATVISTDLPLIGQAKAGEVIRFKKVSVEEAQEIFIENEKLFLEIANSLEPAQPDFFADFPADSNKSLYKIRINGKDYQVAAEEVF